LTRAGRRALLATLLALALAPAARASDVSLPELLRLAARARTDPTALARLKQVDSVAGTPVDMRRELEGAKGAVLRHRLGTLAGAVPGSAADARRARGDAGAILSQRRFHRHGTPAPFRRPLRWLSHWVHRVGSAIGGLIDRIGKHVPGGNRTVWTVIAAFVIAIAAALAARIVRRQARQELVRERAEQPRALDPRRLEREADEAERAGDLERAIRLRFRAGLLRLDRAKAIELRDSMTSGEVARKLRSPDFDGVARTFDEVVYGRREARPPDVQSHREGWTRVLATAGAR
jgi:hypothetical protein